MRNRIVQFLPRDAMQVRSWELQFCPSICLSHACFVTNPKNLPAIFLYHTKGQSFQFSDAKDLSEIPTGSPQRGRQREVGQVKMAIFDQYLAISHKRCKIGTQLLWNANRNLQVIYRLVLFLVTLSDANYPKPPHFRRFVSSFISSQ